MRLKGVVLENFRRYRYQIYVPIHDLTAFIGKNDAGKSTILEALDIFFENTKPDPGDACADGDPGNVVIGAIFTDLPSYLDLDRGARTRLSDEHLLNGEGDLEVLKTYNLGAQKPGAPKVHVKALHPSREGFQGLIQKNNSDLKGQIRSEGLESKCNLNENPSMRRTLFENADDLELQEQAVSLTEGDGKNVWQAVQRNLPVYALFRSDRASTDRDPEVQNPMNLAIERALADVQKDLDEIVDRVRKEAEERAQETLEQLQEQYPDIDLGSGVKPIFRRPTWNKVFNLDLEAGDGVPLNKRGSGVRRLVLLGFFQAEANRSRREKAEEKEGRVPVIYAVEEPETSQHPEVQEDIIRAFKEMAEEGDQVLMTTHVPALAGLLPLESLRYVYFDRDDAHVRVEAGSSDVYERVAADLGVLPDAVKQPGVKVAVLVEGKTDVDALQSLGDVLAEAGEIRPLNEGQVFWALGGGDTLKDWVERKYLERLGLPQVCIFDSDRERPGDSLKRGKEKQKEVLEGREETTVFVTRKREIENYVHSDAVERISGGRLQFPANTDFDHDRVHARFKEVLEDAKARSGEGPGIYPEDREGDHFSPRINDTKKILTAYVMRHMTADEIRERAAYSKEDGTEGHEIREWLEAILTHLD